VRRRRARNGDDRGAPELDIATRAAAASTGGLSAERLRRMHGVLDGYVERGEVPGLVALVARRGGLHVHVAGSTSVGGRPVVVVLRAPRAARAQQEFASGDLETAQAA